MYNGVNTLTYAQHNTRLSIGYQTVTDALKNKEM